jgi:hypothetical protein
MTRSIFYSALIFCLLFFTCDSKIYASAKEKKIEVYLVGAIHNMHLKENYHYSMTNLLEQISKIKPDFVCGEITPDGFNTPTEGYFPPEAALLAQMVDCLHYKFIPVDWRVDFKTQQEAEKRYPDAIMRQIESIPGWNWVHTYNDSLLSVYDHIHNPKTIKTIDTIYQIITSDYIADIAHGAWLERNRRIVDNGMNVNFSDNNKPLRIVYVFGVDHISRLIRELKRYDVEIIIPPRMFIVDNNDNSLISSREWDKMIERWKRNLENLKAIRDRKIDVGENYYLKIINSKRIKDLEEVINYYSSGKY